MHPVKNLYKYEEVIAVLLSAVDMYLHEVQSMHVASMYFKFWKILIAEL